MSEIDLRENCDGFTHTTLSNGGASSWRPGKHGTSSAVGGFCKFALDALIAIVGLAILLPMILMLIAMLYILQGRPIFIAHRRIGKDGAMFGCLKFRTMVHNAEEALSRYLAANPHKKDEWNATRKLKDDPRVTPLGAILRKSSIDELPQLLNVLQGTMSLVGPRPITPSEAELYGANFADYTRVRPGLTGLWQVSGRSDTSYAERVQLDARYVRERSLIGDIRILFQTVPAVIRSSGSY